MKTWGELKQQGSQHYKSGSVEPIDLYRDAGAFRDFALCSIIKYAYRNIGGSGPVSVKDMGKVIHYAELLMAACGEEREL
jgi:hypothetical protein